MRASSEGLCLVRRSSGVGTGTHHFLSWCNVPSPDILLSDCWLYFVLTWRRRKDVIFLTLHGDILRDDHSMFENPTHVLMPCQARVQIHVVWHLKWTRLVDYQVLFSDDKHVDLCGVISAMSWMVWVLMDTELYQLHTHTYAPFTTKDRQSHLVAEIGTRPNLMTSCLGP